MVLSPFPSAFVIRISRTPPVAQANLCTLDTRSLRGQSRVRTCVPRSVLASLQPGSPCLVLTRCAHRRGTCAVVGCAAVGELQGGFQAGHSLPPALATLAPMRFGGAAQSHGPEQLGIGCPSCLPTLLTCLCVSDTDSDPVSGPFKLLLSLAPLPILFSLPP